MIIESLFFLCKGASKQVNQCRQIHLPQLHHHAVEKALGAHLGIQQRSLIHITVGFHLLLLVHLLRDISIVEPRITGHQPLNLLIGDRPLLLKEARITIDKCLLLLELPVPRPIDLTRSSSSNKHHLVEFLLPPEPPTHPEDPRIPATESRDMQILRVEEFSKASYQLKERKRRGML